MCLTNVSPVSPSDVVLCDLISVFVTNRTGFVSCVALSPNGAYALAGSYDKQLRLWCCEVDGASILNVTDEAEEEEQWDKVFYTLDQTEGADNEVEKSGMNHDVRFNQRKPGEVALEYKEHTGPVRGCQFVEGSGAYFISYSGESACMI